LALVNLKEMLYDACKKDYAIGMFDVVNSDSLKAIISGAEECNSPVIIALAEVYFPYAPLELFAPMMLEAAKRSKVPVAVHLDHGKKFESILMAIHYGFNSVMFDGSTLDYEENLKATMEVVKTAKAFDVSVEAELGHVGGEEGGNEEDDDQFYTEPEMAADFVQKTQIDSLAVAIGTVHGEYVKKPCLDLNRLSKINDFVNIPLVLHGGSGLSDQDFKNCIQRGIRKINIFTDMSYAATNGIRIFLEQKKKFHCFEISEAAEKSIKKVVMEKINLFGSNSKA